MDELAGIYPAVSVKKTTYADDLHWCATLMASNEPWITLQRNYDHSITLLKDPRSEVYLFSQEDKRIGFIMIKLRGAFTGYIQTIVFVSAVRSKGIGEAAIRYIESEIFKVSPNVFICVSSFNTGARKLYLRLGYSEVGLLKDYIIKGYDEVLMRKTIGPLNDFKKQTPVIT